MNPAERRALANNRAATYAPRPSDSPFMAGVCVATVALVGYFVVSGFYGWEVRENLPLAVGIAATGFLVGLVCHKNLRRKNRRAVRSELKQINSDEDSFDEG